MYVTHFDMMYIYKKERERGGGQDQYWKTHNWSLKEASRFLVVCMCYYRLFLYSNAATIGADLSTLLPMSPINPECAQEI